MWKMTEHKNISPDQDMVSRFKKFGPLASQMEIERVLRMPLYANHLGLLLTQQDEEKALLLANASKRTKFTGNTDDEHRTLARSAAGLLPLSVCQFFENRITKPEHMEKKSIVLFSAHDYTIMAFLSQMGFREWQIPNFASALIIELHKVCKGKFEVRIKYNPDPSITKSVKDLRTYKMPLDNNHVNMEEATEGSGLYLMRTSNFPLHTL